MPPFLGKPKIAVLFTSFRCDLRCAMCYSWIKQRGAGELSAEKIGEIFDDRFLRDNLEIVNITGGEPTLRDDLADIVKAISDRCRRLRRIDISTNGVDTERVVDRIEQVSAVILPLDIRLTASVSLDGVGRTHEEVRGKGGIFCAVERTIDELKDLTALYPFLSLGLNMTIGALNYSAIREVRDFAAQKGLGVSFTLAALSEIGVESARMKEGFEMASEAKRELISSIERVIVEGAIPRRYGKFIIEWLRTGRRLGPCSFRRGRAFLVEPNGDSYLCGNFKEFWLGNVCEEGFSRIWRNRKRIPPKAWQRCASCASNCYLGT